jgi:hypothetical protein
MGKTQIAAAYARERAEAGIDILIWADASSREGVISAYSQTIARVRQLPEPYSQNEILAIELLHWLSHTEKSWLVVLDDVASPETLAGLWPAGEAGRAILTTRRRDAAFRRSDRTLIEVGVFSIDEATTYLSSKLLASGAPPEAMVSSDELLEHLGRLPLAVAHAAALMGIDELSCAEYLLIFLDRRRSLKELFPYDSGDDYSRTVPTTWSLAFERANALEPAGLAGELAHALAVLDGNGIPEAVVQGRAIQSFLSQRVPLGHLPTPTDVRRALRNLSLLSLVQFSARASKPLITMHALVQRATFDHMDIIRRADAARAAASSILDLKPSDSRDHEQYRILIANANAVIRSDYDAMWSDARANPILLIVGSAKGDFGLVSDAFDYFSELAASSRERLGKHHQTTINFREQAAGWLAHKGDTFAAVQSYEELLMECRQEFGDDSPIAIRVRAYLTRWKAYNGEAPSAVADLEDILKRQIASPSSSDSEIFWTRYHIAHERGLRGNPTQAVKEYDDLSRTARSIGMPSWISRSIEHQIAYFTGQGGDALRAVSKFQSLTVARLKEDGAVSPYTLTAILNLGRWAGEAGDHRGALIVLEHLLNRTQDTFEPIYETNVLGRLYQASQLGNLGDAEAALRLLNGLLADIASHLEGNHSRVLQTRLEHAHWTSRAQGPHLAETLFRPLVSDISQALGPGDPLSLEARTRWTQTLVETGDYTKAIGLLEALVQDAATSLGPLHHITLLARALHAYTQEFLGDPPLAKVNLLSTLQDTSLAYGPRSTKSAEIEGYVPIVAESRQFAGSLGYYTVSSREHFSDRQNFERRILLAEHVGQSGLPGATVVELARLTVVADFFWGADSRECIKLKKLTEIWSHRAVEQESQDPFEIV